MSQTLNTQQVYREDYFDDLYSDNNDPWQYQTRWYEKRKRDICLSILPQAQYNKAIELGCGNGVFSELLARRCQSLISIDGNHKAVQLATERLKEHSQVDVIQGVIPQVFNSLNDNQHSPFDLIVISEILYYLFPQDIDNVITWIKQNLAKGGTLLCCHWRYDIDEFEINGDEVHQRLQSAFSAQRQANNKLNFTHQSQFIDSDFLLDIWQNTPKTVAMQEGLV